MRRNAVDEIGWWSMVMHSRRDWAYSLAGLLTAFACWNAQADDCVRSTPSAIFAADRGDIRAHTFTLKSEHEAIERFRLASGIRVEVAHGGCEYLVNTLRFESNHLFAKGWSVADSYKEAASMLRMLQGAHAETNFDLGLAAATLLEESGRKRNPTMNRELAIHGDGEPPLEAGVKISAAGRRKGAGYLEVTLFRGPL